MPDELRLAEITPDTVAHAVRIQVKPGQERFVAPVPISLAEAYANHSTAWPRVLFDGDEAVAFVMAGFDPDSEIDFFRCGVWRLNVAADKQGLGYGRAAVEAVFDEARSRDQRRATVLWVPGEGGPEGFWLRMGFAPTGEEFHGQIVAEIFLD